MPRSLALMACLLAATPLAAAPWTAADLMKLKRISDPQLSPDGRFVLFTATDVDLQAGSKNDDLWLVPVAGGEPRRLTTDPKSDTRGRFSPDGRRIAFISNRDGSSQAYLMDVAGGEPRKVTSLSTGADGVLWIDKGTLLVTSSVFPECGADDACNQKRLGTQGAPSAARVYEHLLYRHWDSWSDGRRSHLVAVPLDGGALRDLTPGDRDVPPFSLGDPDAYAVSPDGREICFSRNDDASEATSTNADLFVVGATGGAPRKIADHPGFDGAPQYSPDGSRIAYRAQLRAGYESDRWRLMVYDRSTGATRSLTEDFDRHVEGFAWSADSRTLFFLASDNGRTPLYSVPSGGGPVKRLAEAGTLSEVAASPDGKVLVLTKASLTAPNEIYRVGVDGTGLLALTRMNDAVLAPFGLRAGESVTYAGALGKAVQAWVVKPPDFDASRKYPLLVLIHGGPEGEWPDGWTYRWNAQVFASAGFVVFQPNPRGSIGWGQAFIDDINGDWGGKAYEDIMKGTDFAEGLPYVERGRTVAAGASYGGYMIDWIAGHTGRFRGLVSHDGVFDLVSEYGATEELWFPEWEYGGPYWERPEAYARFSPHLFAKNFKTPTLVIHGERDYRVPLEQGLAFFTALQRQGVPSKLVVFPDENHWVLKPANSVRWYGEVLSWLRRWSGSGAP